MPHLEDLKFAFVPTVHDLAGGVLADELDVSVSLSHLHVLELRDPVALFLQPTDKKQVKWVVVHISIFNLISSRNLRIFRVSRSF